VLVEDGLLFSGDHILNGSTTIVDPPDGDMTAYLDSLDALDAACEASSRIEFILPAHGYVLGFAQPAIAHLKAAPPAARGQDCRGHAQAARRHARTMAAHRLRRRARAHVAGGGAVRVDGVAQMLPQSRVLPHQNVEIAAGAKPEPVVPVTLLLYKPAGMPTDNAHRLLVAANHHEPERAGQRFLPVHAKGQHCMTPLETGASGLVAYTQEFRIERKLQEDAGILEHEVMVDVAGPVSPETLARAGALARPREHRPPERRADRPALCAEGRAAGADCAHLRQRGTAHPGDAAHPNRPRAAGGAAARPVALPGTARALLKNGGGTLNRR
jgi:hypothetical protein